MAKQTKEVTVEEIIAAAKEGLQSKSWLEIMALPLTHSPAAYALRAAIAKGEQIIEYQKTTPDNYDTNINDIKDKANYAPRGSHQVLCSENGSIALKDDGTISLASDTVNHFEMDNGGNLSMVNVDTSIKTNSFSLESDDVVVNNHKLNQKLYELADFKQVIDTYDGTPRIAGGLTMLGTVLVKAWEPNLKRYVLVRRQINIPVFSPSIGGPNVHPGINVTPDTEFIRKFKKSLNMSGISSYEDLMASMQATRNAAIATQEQATAAENENIKKENQAKQATSMTTLTGQNAGGMSPTQVAAGTVPSGNGAANNMAPTSKPAVAGWDTANNRPNDTEAYWYKVECKAHKFYVMKGHNVIETWPCNYSSYGATENKIAGDNKTPLGTFQIASVIKNNMADDVKGEGECKIPGASGVFGPYYMDISAGNGIAVHGDYPSEDAKGVSCLTNDAKLGTEAVEGQGSTHGCIRLSNANVTTLATKYAQLKTGQYIKIEA